MTKRLRFVGVLALAAAAVWPSQVQAQVVGPSPSYVWASRATLVVAGRVESADAKSGTLRITRTLAGRHDGETLAFAPTSYPRCVTFTSEPEPVDVAKGDEVALFLVKGEGATYQVLESGYAVVGLGARRALTTGSLADVERLVSIMQIADLDARDRAMIAAATSDGGFLRRAACSYVRTDLGVAQPFDHLRATPAEEAAATEAHRAAVRRFGDEIGTLVRRENGGDVTGAAIAALADASCAPPARLRHLVRFVADIRAVDVYQFRDACRVLACSDSPVAADLLVRLSAEQAEVLAHIGANRSAEVRKALFGAFLGSDERRAAEAARGLAGMLQRGRDAEIEEALLARLRGDIGTEALGPVAWALRTSHPVDAANAVLDKLAEPSLSKDAEEAGARVLFDYLRWDPPFPGVREVVVKRQAVFIERLDAGKTEASRALWVLQQIATPEARTAMRRAGESFPDADLRREAKWRAERFGE